MERSLHILGGVSDMYWEYKVYWEQDHVAAWQMAWEQAEEVFRVVTLAEMARSWEEVRGARQG